MKINRKKLIKGLNIALKIIPKGDNVPVLKAVKLDGPGQKLVAVTLQSPSRELSVLVSYSGPP
jgi:DNA polymerase III sliding clamp (beta) subunit (PCNA family)